MNMQSVRCDNSGAEALTNGILLSIFHFLEYDDLINAEQVCGRWKTVVETCFATEKQLRIGFLITAKFNHALNRMKRYGSSVETLYFSWHDEYEHAMFNWAIEIADRYPNLLTLKLWENPITKGDFKHLSEKCCHLEDVSLIYCKFTAEGLRTFLHALPGMKYLSIKESVRVYEEDSLFSRPTSDVSAVFSTCRNLHTFKMWGAVRGCDTASFSRFCKECVTLRELDIRVTYMRAVMFAQIQNCSLLEKLYLDECDNVDDLALIQISQGCPNLREVTFLNLPVISDRGLRCFAKCKNLNLFHTDVEIADETVVELSKCVNLREVKVLYSRWVSDRGCAALLAHCPRLELLDVTDCKGVSNATVDSAIEAVECRQNGLVLYLHIFGTDATPQSHENIHPLLRLTYENQDS